MDIQSLDWVAIKANKLFMENPRRSLSAMYREFRRAKEPSISSIGDYPLLWTILNEAYNLGINFSKKQMYTLFKNTRDLTLTDKVELVANRGIRNLTVASYHEVLNA